MRKHRPQQPEPLPDGTDTTALASVPDAGEHLDAEPTAVSNAAPVAQPGTSRVAGWRRVFSGNRSLWVTTGAATACLIAGLLVGRFVISPADAAANATAPEAGYITVPVEFGTLTNDVTMRGQVGYADSTEVKLSAAEGGDTAVVTGAVPKTGDKLDAGDIALEVAGRPVFVLPGKLPAYRTLRVGSSGPDVKQLKQALAAEGIPVAVSKKFDTATAKAVRTLYLRAGYTAPVDSSASEQVKTARESLRQADSALAQARKALSAANSGPSAVTRKEANNAVAEASRALKAARATDPPDALEIARLTDELALAKLRRKEALKKADTTAEKESLSSAKQQRADAVKQLATAKKAALPYLPASEVLYLTQLPRRVDEVKVERGSVISGPVMNVSGAKLELSGSASAADTKLLEVGQEAFFELPDGEQHRAVIAKIEAGKSDRSTIEFTPDPLTDEQTEQLKGSNVRLTIAVGSSEGEVLSVPLAALTAGPGGEARVEVVEGDPRDKERARTRLVVVRTGLAAEGYVEVTPLTGALAKADLVVVGA
ncbi:MAG TPA: hypothetical protein PKV13_05495 [Propionicimonas sp.]|mgnify:CR=1 FL=1|nr:hypothetical protein [Propionicimonas sp.]HRA06057.1 hypothetical protein [Propionicimonas sp.]